MSRFVMDSNNLWLLAISDRTIRVLEGPVTPDLNGHDIPAGVADTWKKMARIGTNRHSTHRELEVFGVVFSGPKLEELRTGIMSGQQRFINREGFAITWLNRGGGSTNLRTNSLLRRLNDLYDWSRHGVTVPLPVETEWDRFELITGKVMVAPGGGGGSAQMKKEMEEKERENQRLQAEKDKEIEQLKKQAEENEAKNNKEIEELKKQAKEKDDQLAAKDKQIGNLRTALAAFT